MEWASPPAGGAPRESVSKGSELSRERHIHRKLGLTPYTHWAGLADDSRPLDLLAADGVLGRRFHSTTPDDSSTALALSRTPVNHALQSDAQLIATASGGSATNTTSNVSICHRLQQLSSADGINRLPGLGVAIVAAQVIQYLYNAHYPTASVVSIGRSANGRLASDVDTHPAAVLLCS